MSQALDEGKISYRGRSWQLRDSKAKKSAEVVLVVENELRKDTAEVSPNNEGLNVKSFQIQ